MKTSLYLFIALLLLCGGCEKALPRWRAAIGRNPVYEVKLLF